MTPKHDKADKAKEFRQLINAFSQLSVIGITFVVCVLIGVFFGRFLDSIFNTSPFLLLIFAIVGVLAGFKYMVDIYNKMS